MSKKPVGKVDRTKEQKDTSPYVFQRDKIHYELKINELPWTPRQKEIIERFLDKKTKVLFLRGPAGSSKTMLAMYCGLHLLNSKKVSDLILIRSAVESADSKLGYLPGTMEEKFDVYLQPFYEKFGELLTPTCIQRLQKDDRITMCPINFARGLHFSVRFVCSDESQNLTAKEIFTLMTRLGPFCKTVICGDPDQSDLPKGKSGFNAVYNLFDNAESQEHGIYCETLTDEDIVRSELCKFIASKFKSLTQHDQPKRVPPNNPLMPDVGNCPTGAALDWRPGEV
jgi:phosphate starvation-inducible PhoH-like protein